VIQVKTKHTKQSDLSVYSSWIWSGFFAL
jgi:hypothetical protein